MTYVGLRADVPNSSGIVRFTPSWPSWSSHVCVMLYDIPGIALKKRQSFPPQGFMLSGGAYYRLS